MPRTDPSAPDVVVEGTIHTLDPERPRAGAVLVRDGRIACVGSGEDCAGAARAGAMRIRAGSAVPGLVDAHGHVEWLGRSRREVTCEGAASDDECARRAAERARSLPRGSWVRGRGWDESRWPGARLPSEATLTRAVPDHPAVLTRVDGHASWVNAAALAAAGIGAATPDPPGGRILRDARGRPSGVLLDAAQDLVLREIPPAGAGEIEDALVEGLRALAALGLTAVHDAGVRPEALDVYRKLAREDRLPLRVYAMIDGEVPLGALEAEMSRWRGAPEGPGGAERAGAGRLAVRAVKLYADGALGSRGAALFEDYSDDPGNRGFLLCDPEVLRARIAAVARAGFQPAVHAIGDRAVAETATALEAAGDRRALRPRVEHLQIARAADLSRLAAVGAIASMQPSHVASDGRWIASRLGPRSERTRHAYAWRSALLAGLPLAFGSDFPVESADPRLGLHAAETRVPEGAADAFLPEERLGRLEALAAFTSGAAYASFAEGRRGILREGLDADLTLFAEDVMEVGSDELRRVRATHAIVAGSVAWAADG